MNLKDFLARGESKDRKLYWALIIEPGYLQAGIWEIVDGAADVISVSPPTRWDAGADVIGASDTALSSAAQSLPEEIAEPENTVFGVPSAWVHEGEIKKEHLDVIKKVCTELSLTPVGFVVLPEAIAHLIKSEEGTPLNAVVLGIGDEDLEVSVFKLGSLIGSATVARSVSLADDLREGLMRFAAASPFPSRVLIYNGKEGELEDEKQAILQASWEEEEKIKFLHLPKVEIISPERKVIATSLAGASEIANVTTLHMRGKSGEKAIEAPAEEVGNVTVPESGVSAADLGFLIGKDVAREEIPAKFAPPAPPEVLSEELPVGKSFQPGQKFSFAKVTGVLSGLFAHLLRPFRREQAVMEVKGSDAKRMFVLGGLFFLFIIFGAALLWWFCPKANVTVYVSPKKLEENFSLTVDPAASGFDASEMVVVGKVISADVSGDKTKSTTGTKTVGDRAKGSVTIENGTAAAVNLAAGSFLTSGGGLRFTLDNSASVSAALSPSEPGTATADVTAADIGAQYNLAKGEVFKVSNYPKVEVDAVSAADFTGGSSRQITAVSADDQKSLTSGLEEELLQSAKEKLQSGVSADDYFIDSSVHVVSETPSFNNKVGDEASTLKLNLALSTVGVVISRENLYNLAREVLKDKVPPGFVLKSEQLVFGFNMVSVTDNTFKFNVQISANVLPSINTDEVAAKISGKYPAIAEEYLTTTIPGFDRAKIVLSPSLPGKLGSLPRVPKNITVEIAAEK